MEYAARKVRRFINNCYMAFRPIRRQLRNPETRVAMLKWTLLGTVLYLVLYIAFYIISRHKYLLGFNDYESDLLMKQYERDLQTCWHSTGADSAENQTNPLNSWPTDLRYVTYNHSMDGTYESQVRGIRREHRTILTVPQTVLNQTQPHSTQRVLDAGSCVSLPTQLNTALRGSDSTTESGSIHCLPSFIIAGAMKCGTGELMKWLQLHPKLALGTGAGDQREVHFFTSTFNSAGGIEEALNPFKLVDYAQYFPAFTPAQAREVYTFEKSPDYIREHTALRNIHALLPSVKIVLLLRNPSLRALSEFNHHCRHGRYAKLIKDVHIRDTSTIGGGVHYLKDDVVRIDTLGNAGSGNGGGGAGTVLPKGSNQVLDYPCSAEDAERYFMRPTHTRQRRRRQLSTAGNNTLLDHSSSSGDHVPEIEHGYFEHQLRHLFELFPAEQVLVLLQEDMYRHTFRTLRQVEEFLQLPCFDYKDFILQQPLSSGATGSLDALLRQPEGEGGTQGTEEDDGFNEATALETSGSKDSKEGDGKDTGAALRPPKRRPVTAAEQIAHYRAELKAFLASWRGTEDQMRHLYSRCSPQFRDWLDHTVYQPHNQRLVDLLHGQQNRAAFSPQHLKDMGWTL